jgi:hypothetical protein
MEDTYRRCAQQMGCRGFVVTPSDTGELLRALETKVIEVASADW